MTVHWTRNFFSITHHYSAKLVKLSPIFRAHLRIRFPIPPWTNPVLRQIYCKRFPFNHILKINIYAYFMCINKANRPTRHFWQFRDKNYFTWNRFTIENCWVLLKLFLGSFLNIGSFNIKRENVENYLEKQAPILRSAFYLPTFSISHHYWQN